MESTATARMQWWLTKQHCVKDNQAIHAVALGLSEKTLSLRSGARHLRAAGLANNDIYRIQYRWREFLKLCNSFSPKCLNVLQCHCTRWTIMVTSCYDVEAANAIVETIRPWCLLDYTTDAATAMEYTGDKHNPVNSIGDITHRDQPLDAMKCYKVTCDATTQAKDVIKRFDLKFIVATVVAFVGDGSSSAVADLLNVFSHKPDIDTIVIFAQSYASLQTSNETIKRCTVTGVTSLDVTRIVCGI